MRKENDEMKVPIEQLTDEQLNMAVAEVVMGWERTPENWWRDTDDRLLYSVIQRPYDNTRLWSPATNIADTFRVDKPEWDWESTEWKEERGLQLLIHNANVPTWDIISHVTLSLDHSNKIPTHCRGRCLAALKACGVTEWEVGE